MNTYIFVSALKMLTKCYKTEVCARFFSAEKSISIQSFNTVCRMVSVRVITCLEI